MARSTLRTSVTFSFWGMHHPARPRETGGVYLSKAQGDESKGSQSTNATGTGETDKPARHKPQPPAGSARPEAVSFTLVVAQTPAGLQGVQSIRRIA